MNIWLSRRIVMFDRRDFLKSGAAVGASALLAPSILGATDTTPNFSDYKAIVVLALEGGNDGYNTFIPIGAGDDEYGYNAYLKAREAIAVRNKDLSSELKNAMNANGDLELGKGSGNLYYEQDNALENYQSGFYAHNKGYDKDGNTLNLNFNNKIGTHGYMPELANLTNQGKVAVVSNVGNLYEPTTRDAIMNARATLPPFLMAHDHQFSLAANGNALNLRDFGLFGKLHDAWKSLDGDNIYGMNTALFQSCHMLYGRLSNPTIFNRNGVSLFSSLNYRYEVYTDMISSWKRKQNYKRYYNNLRDHSFKVVQEIKDVWEERDDIYENLLGSYGEKITTPTDDSWAAIGHGGIGVKWEPDLLSAAKLIKIGKDSGLKRQIVYIRMASFDTHGNQREFHGKYLRSLDTAIGKFQRIMKKLGLEESVTTISMSDFGRSIGANSDGTDHAWGNNLFVIGGAVKGGLYGKQASLKLGGEDDMSYKGRLIPTTSMSQYYNTILEWFGADEDLRNNLLVDLKNFDNKNLGFMA